IARLVTPEISRSMGAGIATFDGCSIEWTVLYDEVIVVLDGRFRLRTGEGYKRTIEAGPGDVIWLPENTPLKYEGDKATVFYALRRRTWRGAQGRAEAQMGGKSGGRAEPPPLRFPYARASLVGDVRKADHTLGLALAADREVEALLRRLPCRRRDAVATGR